MLYDGDTFAFQGHSFSISMPPDDSGDAPWERDDCCGPVSPWTSRDKLPGELVLCACRGSRRFYDFAGACKLARTEWGCKGRKAAAEAARKDYERLAAWCRDQWCFVGVVVTLLDDDGEPTNETASLWGVESDLNEYIEEVAHECASEILGRFNKTGAAALHMAVSSAGLESMYDPVC